MCSREARSGTAGSRTDWLDELAPLVSAAAMSVLYFVGLIVLANLYRIEPRFRNAEIFLASISVVPILAASLQSWSDRCQSGAGRIFEAINIWCATATLLSLAAVRGSGFSAWQAHSLFVATCSLLAHLGLCVLLLLGHLRPSIVQDASNRIAQQSPRSVQITAFAVAFAIAIIILFRIDKGSKFGGAFSFLVPASQGGYPQLTDVVLALLLAGIAVAVGGGILLLERRSGSRTPAQRLAPKLVAFLLGLIVVIALFFDFSLAADPFHYMTIIGPALHLLHGGTLMIDTFSQYGPGPVLLAYLAFQFGPPSFAVAQMAIQICNLAFYGLFLIALCQRTRFPMAAIWFGLLIVQIWMAGWGNGDGNVNAAPSVLGARYLPAMLMVVAIGMLRERRQSILTFAASMLAAIWSFEAVVGVVAVHAGFVALANLRERTYRRLVHDVALVALPIVAGLLLVGLVTFFVSGKLLSLETYLGFLSSYNPVAQFWSVPFAGTFWSWSPFLFAIVLTIAGLWLLTIDIARDSLIASGEDWLRLGAPAAVLAAITGAYFAGRSVDFTILIALLPLALLVVPPSLKLADIGLSGDRSSAALAALAAGVMLWGTTFPLLYLFRAYAPYSLPFHECKDMGRCTPSALARGVAETVRRELTLEPGDNLWALAGYDRAVVTEARDLIDRFSRGASQVTVLLGASAGGHDMLSDVALMYAQKWHTWPRSFTFSDQLVPALVDRILAAPIKLATGDLVLLRRDTAELGPIESGILKRLRSHGRLCNLDAGATEVSAYRFWKLGEPPPDAACVDGPEDDPGVSKAERAGMAALGELIGRIRDAAGPLSDGFLDGPALARSGIQVPQTMLRKQHLVSFWGPAAIMRSADHLVIDLNGIHRSTCNRLLVETSHIPGVARVANSGALSDEQSTPVSEARATQLCARNTGMARIIVERKR